MTWIIDSFTTLADSISNYISLAVEIIVGTLFYPVTMISYWGSSILNLIFEPFIEFADNLMVWNNLLFDFLLSVLANILPLTHGLILFTAITIVLFYRLYHFLKDINILGNSI